MQISKRSQHIKIRILRFWGSRGMQSSCNGVFTAHKTLILCSQQTGVFWGICKNKKVSLLFSLKEIRRSKNIKEDGKHKSLYSL